MQITIFPKADLDKLDKNEAAQKAAVGNILQIRSKQDMLEAIIKYAWSPSIFKESKRMNKNFIKAYFLAFDIDEGLPLIDIITKIKSLSFKCIIGTSVNHGKAKGGVSADRYRVIFPLLTPIYSAEVFKATWLSLAGEKEGVLFGADNSCKDVARFFFPCKIVSYLEGSRKLAPVKLSINSEKTVKKQGIEGGIEKGQLSSRTLDFLENGTVKCSSRHKEFILTVFDLKAQGYTKEETKEIAIPVMKRVKPEEKAEQQINYIYDRYNVKFDYREKKKND